MIHDFVTAAVVGDDSRFTATTSGKHRHGRNIQIFKKKDLTANSQIRGKGG